MARDRRRIKSSGGGLDLAPLIGLAMGGTATPQENPFFGMDEETANMSLGGKKADTTSPYKKARIRDLLVGNPANELNQEFAMRDLLQKRATEGASQAELATMREKASLDEAAELRKRGLTNEDIAKRRAELGNTYRILGKQLGWSPEILTSIANLPAEVQGQILQDLPTMQASAASGQRSLVDAATARGELPTAEGIAQATGQRGLNMAQTLSELSGTKAFSDALKEDALESLASSRLENITKSRAILSPGMEIFSPREGQVFRGSRTDEETIGVNPITKEPTTKKTYIPGHSVPFYTPQAEARLLRELAAANRGTQGFTTDTGSGLATQVPNQETAEEVLAKALGIPTTAKLKQRSNVQQKRTPINLSDLFERSLKY